MEYNTPDTNPYNKPEADLSHTAGAQVETLKHSGLGITSFILSIICGIGLLACLVVAGVMSMNGEMDEHSMEAILLGFGILIFIFLDLIALIFGIVGWVQKNRKNLFSILGTVFSGVSLIAIIGIIMLGLAMS